MNDVKFLTNQLNNSIYNNDVISSIRKQIIDLLKPLKFESLKQAKEVTGLSYLGSVNSSSKIVKNLKKDYHTYILYLAPYKASGFNTCPKASKGCIDACLNTSGRVKMDVDNVIITARLLKTILFYANREFFNSWLFAEIEQAKKLASKKGFEFSVRLNGTSDLNINLFKVNNQTVLQRFSDVQFYDYTKVFNRLPLTKENQNYHLTFSYSGQNVQEMFDALDLGYNVAVPFLVDYDKPLPNSFLGHKVCDADETDLRFLDTERIAGLRVKQTKDKDAISRAVKEGFIIDMENFSIKNLIALATA